MEKSRKVERNLKKVLERRQTKAFVVMLLVVVVLCAGSASRFGKAISNQEFFSYHVKDIMNYFFGEPEVVSAETQEFGYETSLDGPLYGVAKGKNLIVIQVESFQNFLIGREYNGVEITPNLNQLVDKDSIYFDNFYMQVAMGNTSDAEFAINNSLYGAEEYCTYALYDKNYFRGLPILLKEKGYDVAAFHGYKKEFWNRSGAYPSLGFDTFYSEEDFHFKDVVGFGMRDDDFFQQSTEYMQKMTQPFYSFLITLSNHHPFPLPSGEKAIPAKKGDKGTLVYDYINSARFTDKCIGEFVEQLKKDGLYENSVIAIYGDHFGLTTGDPDICASMKKLLGKNYDVDEMAKIPLIIHIPGEEVKQTISISGGQIDFMPTIAYLMGFESLDTLYLGQNLITAEHGFVAEGIYFPKGSFIKDDIFYVMARDAVYENGRAWNIKTGEKVELEEYEKDSMKAVELINRSQSYLKSDAIGQMQGKMKRASSVKDPSLINKPTKGIAVTAPPEKATTTPEEVQPIDSMVSEQEQLDTTSPGALENEETETEVSTEPGIETSTDPGTEASTEPAIEDVTAPNLESGTEMVAP